ncbi:hypothetical protein [uncultured Agrobacterium sp.]|uniref:hypothetical protein n=1 Tax=uncultured Agrobacterium sp. TaxID=157277 RepID=UPI0025FB2408|nr:hypothetical protein [uncultured Agrobacterium sp.]
MTRGLDFSQFFLIAGTKICAARFFAVPPMKREAAIKREPLIPRHLTLPPLISATSTDLQSSPLGSDRLIQKISHKFKKTQIGACGESDA